MQLRNSLIYGGSQTFRAYSNVEDNEEDDGYDSGVNDFGDDMYMDEDVPIHQEQQQVMQQPVLMYQQQISYESRLWFFLVEIGFIVF